MQPRYQSIEVFFIKEKYITIYVYAVGMFSIRDPLVAGVHLDYDVSNVVLAKQVRESLQKTRGLSLPEFQRLRENKELQEIFYREETNLAQQYGYKSINTMKKKIFNVGITCQNSEIELTPTHQDCLDGYHDIGEVFTYPESISDEELGQKIRDAFELCTSKYN